MFCAVFSHARISDILLLFFFMLQWMPLFVRLDRILAAPVGSKFSLAWYRQNVHGSNSLGQQAERHGFLFPNLSDGSTLIFDVGWQFRPDALPSRMLHP